MFGNCIRTNLKPTALFNVYALFPMQFRYVVSHQVFNNSHQSWQMKPEELFIMLQNCSLGILPSISDASWKQFASTPYKDSAVRCLLQTYSHKENLSISARAYWKEIATKFDADRKSLDKDLSLENETFLLVFIKSLSNDYSRFEKFVAFLKPRSLLSKSMKEKILTHFHELQEQSFLLHLRGIGFASSNCSIL